MINKLTAAFYGILTIFMAFIAGKIGSVLQAAISLAGCLVGPLLGIYIMAIFVPFANVRGVLSGLFCGIGFSTFVLIGSMIYPKIEVDKATSISSCLNVAANATMPINTTVHYETTGILKLFHIAFLLVPVLGFVICLLVSLIVSLLTGGIKKIPNIDTSAMSKLIWHIWPKSMLPAKAPVVQMTSINMDKEQRNGSFKA